jgi:hypothetical protein
MTTKRDSAGRLPRADMTYKLHVPAPVPVAQFRGLTLYSENTRRRYDNGRNPAMSISTAGTRRFSATLMAASTCT